MSGDSNRSGDTGASRADGGNAPPADQPAGGPAGQAQGGYAQAGPGIDYQHYGKIGSAVFATFGLGTALTFFLYLTMASSGTTLGTGSFLGGGGGSNQLFSAVAAGFGFTILIGPVVATGLGAYVSSLTDVHESGALVGAATTAIGAAVTLVVLLVLVVVLAPGSGNIPIGDLLAPTIGAVIGIAATGAGAGYAYENLLSQ